MEMTMSGAQRKKVLSIEEIDAALAEIAALAHQRQINLVLVGGVALQMYGGDRFTADVDFAASDPIPDLKPERELSFGGYQSHTASGVPVDWILRNDDFAEVYTEAILYPQRIEGVPVPVASPEYLVAMKLVAGRTRDELDIETLLGLGAVDVPKVRRIVKRLLGAFAEKSLVSLIEVAAWKRSREEK